jgi:Cof subfamily protein (haloacid dehalogenase superfamily)
MKYDGIVIFSDLDGTLLNDQSELSKENIEAALSFVKQGGIFGVATGRTGWTMTAMFPGLPINTPSIFFNGALIFDIKTKQEIYSAFLPKGLEEILQNVMDRYQDTGMEVNAAGKAYVLRFNDILRLQIAREALPSIGSQWRDIPGNWYKVIVGDRYETLNKIKSEISELKRPDIEVMFSQGEILDIVPKGISKGIALSRLMTANRNNWRKVFAIGDNDNDMELIETADVGIAVANARPCIRTAAKHIIGDNNIPCLPQVLKLVDTYL